MANINGSKSVQSEEYFALAGVFDTFATYARDTNPDFYLNTCSGIAASNIPDDTVNGLLFFMEQLALNVEDNEPPDSLARAKEALMSATGLLAFLNCLMRHRDNALYIHGQA
jgi:hypothetical protein